MEPERRKQLILGVLLVVLAAAGYRSWSSLPATPSASPVPVGGRAPAPVSTSGNPAAALDVHLGRLRGERPDPGEADRNPFRFKPKAVPLPERPVAPAPPPPPPAALAPVASAPTGPPPPPPLPPIALKFVGIVEAPERGLKVAAMSDQFGVYYGREGDTILGQYKILRIGAESLDIAYLDGRGRQTIRLSGT